MALEAAIAAQFALFALFAFLKVRDGARSLYFLGAAGALIAIMLTANLATAFSGFVWANIANIVLELLLGPAIYLYLTRARPSASSSGPIQLIHALPALGGVLLYLTAIRLLDAYIVIVLFTYFAAGIWALLHKPADYPARFLRFAGVLMGLFAAAAVFRAVIPVDATAANFRETPSYTFLLAAILAAAWLVLFVSLRWPDVISAIPTAEKYARSQVDPDATRALAKRLSETLETEALYLQPDLSLESLAERINAAPRHVSQFINSEYGMNFSAYLNLLRVKCASKKLSEADCCTPIKTIMYDAGFRSKSVFNREFRRVFDMTPSEFREKSSAASFVQDTPSRAQ